MKFQGSAFANFLPSMVTMAALCCGVSSVRFASLEQYGFSVLMLAFAAIFDGLDGHVARLLKATSQFGAELDSLCDLVDFGVSPSLVVYLWAHKFPSPYVNDSVLWLACLFFCCSCAFRLARFNMTNVLAPKVAVETEPPRPHSSHSRLRRRSSEPDADSTPGADSNHHGKGNNNSIRHRFGPRRALRRLSRHMASQGQKIIDNYVTRHKFFQGIPAPAAGALSLMPMVWVFEFGTKVAYVDIKLVVAANLVFLSLLMVSKLPTLSSKMLMRNPREESHLQSKSNVSLLLKILLVAAVTALAVYFPWRLLLAGTVVYILLLPVGPVVYHFTDE